MNIIYQITNKVNNKFYIGKTTKTIEERFYFHNHTYDETYLHRALRKYGVDNFTIEIIESQVPDTELDNKERYYIKTLKPHYNLTEGGTGGDTSKSPNFIIGMKKQHANRPPESYASYGMLGKKQTQEQKDAISKRNSYPVMCEGVAYPSIKAAEEYYRSIGTPKSVRKRIDSKRHPDWYRIRTKRIHPSYLKFQ